MENNSLKNLLELLGDNSTLEDHRIIINKMIVLWNETNQFLYPNPVPKELRDE